MIGQLSSVVFDCRDPHGLARFYSELLGLPVTGSPAAAVAGPGLPTAAPSGRPR